MKCGLLLGFAVLLVGCGDKTFDSLCTAQVPPPAACATECSPSASNTCPGGFHCATGGTCDLFCTQAGNECGDGYSCTADGFCIKNGGGGGSGSAMPDSSCPALHFTPMRTTPTVQLLLDESSSMNTNYGGITRLAAMRNALVDPTNGVVTKLANQVVFGVSLYTGTGSAPPTCPTLTSEDRALDNLAPIRSLLNAAAPKSNTPTAASIDAVVADFAAKPPAANSPKIIVLATDGLPDTCADQNPPQQTDPTKPLDPRQIAANATAVEAATRAFAAGIRLYFLFIGDTQARNHPQEMANAGAGLDITTGRAPFFIATSPTDLANAFNTIIGGVVSCDLRLDSQLDPSDAPNGEVTINDQKLSYPADWTLDNDGITIHILGNACDRLKASANPVVDAAFPCGTIIL
jgi:hypothetical protein